MNENEIEVGANQEAQPGSLKRFVRRLAEPKIPVWYLAVILVGSMVVAAILTWLDVGSGE